MMLHHNTFVSYGIPWLKFLVNTMKTYILNCLFLRNMKEKSNKFLSVVHFWQMNYIENEHFLDIPFEKPIFY